MEKELVPYEQSLQLKELGFEELCFGYFDCERDFQFVSNKKKFLICEVARPTFSQAFRWFREKYKLHIEIRSYTARFFTIVIQECKDIVKYIEYGGINLKFNTYEEAELVCIKKLIEIVKEMENKQTSVNLHQDSDTYDVYIVNEGDIDYHLERGGIEHTYILNENKEFATCQCGRRLFKKLKNKQ